VKRRTDDLRRARARADAEGSEGDADPRVSAFLRGVTIGALVGAATASDGTVSDASPAGDEPPPF
jgi:hypothetical protein